MLIIPVKFLGHCGAVKFSANFDLAEKGTMKCNCTICQKTRSWETVMSPNDFAIIQGEGDLTKYTYNSQKFPHYFCKHCGVQTHLTGHIPPMGGDVVMIHVNCLDDVEPRELVDAPLRYFDNLNDAVSNKTSKHTLCMLDQSLICLVIAVAGTRVHKAPLNLLCRASAADMFSSVLLGQCIMVEGVLIGPELS